MGKVREEFAGMDGMGGCVWVVVEMRRFASWLSETVSDGEKDRCETSDSWILRDPLLHGGRLVGDAFSTPSVSSVSPTDGACELR